MWSESYMPITTGNSFNLYFKIILVQNIENLIVCAILPQSLYICKATGHCNIEPTIFEVGYPTIIQGGNSAADKRDMFNNSIKDCLAGYVISLSVIATSAMMLLGQVVVLDKSSLSLEAYNYNQGNKRSNNNRSNDGHHHRKGGGGKRTNSSNGNDANSFWNDGGDRSRNNEKEKRMLSHMKNFVYRSFSLELGALSTSRILSFVFTVYTIHSVLVVALTMFYSSTGRDWYPLVLTLIAIFTAAGGSDVDTADFEELESIAFEINSACYK